MSEPRTRSASEVADHAGDLLHDAQELARVLPESCRELAPLLSVVERLAAQLEDLAAAVVRDGRRNDELHHDQRA